jgi:hypothetical protein
MVHITRFILAMLAGGTVWIIYVFERSFVCTAIIYPHITHLARN